MGEILASASFEHCVILGCPVRENESPCNIPLPRQSHLGIYEGQDYRPTHDWREAFLCLRHGHVYACSPANIRLETDMRGPGQSVSPLWQVDALCGHERCGAVHTLYTGRMPDWHSIVSRIVQLDPELPCHDHVFVWRKELITGNLMTH